VPILHEISRERYAMHATQLFIDWSGVPHVHVECAQMHGAHSTEKVPMWIVSIISWTCSLFGMYKYD